VDQQSRFCSLGENSAENSLQMQWPEKLLQGKIAAGAD
jgi:hypothetical protein